MISARTGIYIGSCSATDIVGGAAIEYPEVMIARTGVGAGQEYGVSMQRICPCGTHMAATCDSHRRAKRIYTSRSRVCIQANVVGACLGVYMRRCLAESEIAIAQIPIQMYGGICIRCVEMHRVASGV